MKFAFSTLGCPRWTPEEVVEQALRLGYDAIEWRLLNGEVIDPVRDAGRVKEAVELGRSQGIESCALDTSCRFNFSDAAQRTDNIGALQAWIRLAGKVGVKLLRVFGGAGAGGTEKDREEENKWVADALSRAAPEAERAGIVVVLETHDDFSSARRTANVLQLVNSPAIAALWDGLHPYRVGETTTEIIGALNGRIAHFHVKDARRRSGANDWELVLVGEGEVPIREQLESLHRYGYQGYVSVEWEKKWHPEIAEPEIALPQHIAWLRAWET